MLARRAFARTKGAVSSLLMETPECEMTTSVRKVYLYRLAVKR